MGIVKISDSLHQEVRQASASMLRSINAQAEYWMMVGMLAETHPEMTYQDIVRKKLLPDLAGYLAESRQHE